MEENIELLDSVDFSLSQTPESSAASKSDQLTAGYNQYPEARQHSTIDSDMDINCQTESTTHTSPHTKKKNEINYNTTGDDSSYKDELEEETTNVKIKKIVQKSATKTGCTFFPLQTTLHK
eukprot:12746162-Ditylum_brightwellii.AAC.1